MKTRVWSENGLSGASVDLIRAADQVAMSPASATTAADGSFTTSTFVMPAGGVFVRAFITGYVTGRILVTSGFDNTTVSIESIPLVPTSSALDGIGGVVRNARTGLGMPGASLALYNNLTSTPVAPATAEANGAYSFTGLAAGTYRVAAPGFQLAEQVGIAVGNNGVTGGQDIVLSPSGTNDIRIVLTWGASPNDLDSHLTGPNANASRFHIYYAARGSFSAAQPPCDRWAPQYPRPRRRPDPSCIEGEGQAEVLTPVRIRTHNGPPFATCALGRLSALSVWWIM